MPEFPIRITADSTQFGATVNGVVGKLNSMVGGFATKLAAIFTIGALERTIHSYINFASQFKVASDDLGVGIEFLQQAAFAAQQTGKSFEQVEQSLRRLRITQALVVANPNTEQGAAAARMGLQPTDTLQDAWLKVQQRIKNGTGSAQEFRDVQLLMGRGAERLVNTFREFDTLAARAPVLTDKMVKQFEQIGNNIHEMVTEIKVAFGPAILNITTMLLRAAQAIRIIIQSAVAVFKSLNQTGGTGGMWKMFNLAVNPASEIARMMGERLKGGMTVKQQLDELAIQLGVAFEKGAATAQDEIDKIQKQWDDLMESINHPKTPPPAGAGDVFGRKLAMESVKPIGSDQYAKIGAYLSAGTVGLAQTQVGLLRVLIYKVENVKGAIDNNTAVMENYE